MLVTIISDVHGHFHLENFENVSSNKYNTDYLFIVGDMVDFGVPNQENLSRYWKYKDLIKQQWGEYVNFVEKSSNNYKKIIYVEGNHHLGVTGFEFSHLDNVIRLQDSYTIIEDIKIYGQAFSYTEDISLAFRWNYMTINPEFDKLIWDKMDKNTNVILSHSPPLGILDYPNINSNIHWGSPGLRNLLNKTKNKHVFCGHVHECGGQSILFNNNVIHNVAGTYCTVVL